MLTIQGQPRASGLAQHRQDFCSAGGHEVKQAATRPIGACYCRVALKQTLAPASPPRARGVRGLVTPDGPGPGPPCAGGPGVTAPRPSPPPPACSQLPGPRQQLCQPAPNVETPATLALASHWLEGPRGGRRKGEAPPFEGHVGRQWKLQVSWRREGPGPACARGFHRSAHLPSRPTLLLFPPCVVRPNPHPGIHPVHPDSHPFLNLFLRNPDRFLGNSKQLLSVVPVTYQLGFPCDIYIPPASFFRPSHFFLPCSFWFWTYNTPVV